MRLVDALNGLFDARAAEWFPSGRIIPMRLGIVLLMGLLACQSIQKSYRQAGNEELEGGTAPTIQGSDWLPAGDLGQAQFESAEWRVVAFFKPD